MKTHNLLALPLLLLATGPAHAQTEIYSHEQGGGDALPGTVLSYHPAVSPVRKANTKVGSRADFTYSWKAGLAPPASQRAQIEAAIEYAHSLIGDTVYTDGPAIDVLYSWEDFVAVGLSARTLAVGGTAYYPGTDPATGEQVRIASPLNNHFANTDLDADHEITVRINNKLVQSGTWYLGTDGKPQLNQSDLVSTLMHELLHGLGFQSVYSYSSGVGKGWEPMPIWDAHVYDSSGDRPLDVQTNDTAALGSLLISGDSYFEGPNTTFRTETSGTRLAGYSTYLDFSHFSPLDYDQANPNSVIVPSRMRGTSMHEVGPAILGALEDLGWFLNPVVGIEDEVILNWYQAGSDPGLLNSGESRSFEAFYYDYEPFGATLKHRAVLRHAGGEYEFYTGQGDGIFDVTIPSNLPDYEWRRDDDGNIVGYLSAQLFDGAIGFDEQFRTLRVAYSPNTPFVQIEEDHGDSIQLGFSSARVGSYIIQCADVTTGSGCVSDLSFPMSVQGVTSLDVTGLDLTHEYEFYVAASNTSGQGGYRLADPYVPDAGLQNVALWLPFDEVTDGLSMDLKQIHTATVLGGSANQELGVDGNSVGLADGAYLEVQDDSSLHFGRNDFSISTWVRSSSTNAYQVLFWKRDNQGQGFYLMLISGTPYFSLSASGGASSFGSQNVADGEWHLVTVTVDRDRRDGGSLYVDGELNTTFNPTVAAGSLQGNSALQIGGIPNYTLDGSMDETLVFSRALSESDVAQLYEARHSGLDKNGFVEGSQILGHWTFDNGDGYDLSGNGLHTTITNGSLTADGKLSLTNGYAALLHPERLSPPEGGFSKLSIEATLSMSNPSQYYNVLFSHPGYTLAAHSFYGSSARTSFRMSGVRTEMALAGGRWGSGPNLWSNPVAEGQSYYWGWEMYAPTFWSQAETHHVRVDYTGSFVELSMDGQLLHQFELAQNDGVLPAATPAEDAYIGRFHNWTNYFLSAEIDEIKITGQP